MAKIDKMVITEVGQNALWNSQNSGVEFEITHVEFGSSNASRDNEYKAVKLNRPEQFKKIMEGVKIKSDQIRIFTDFDGFKDYLVCEIGLWSGEPNKEGSILFAYCASEDNKAFLKITKGVDTVFSYDFVFTDQDISNAQVVADNDQSLVLTLIAKHETDLNAHPYYAHKEADNTFKEVNTFEKPIIGDLKGNASTADHLSKAVKIHGVDFDGTKNIDIPVFSTAKGGVVPQADNDGNKVLYADGSWKTVDLAIVGNAETAEKLKTARTIAISGAVTGTATSFDGSKNITIPTTNVDGSKVTGTVPNATTATKATIADTADTATKLTTARKIHGVDFDGTKNIDLNVFSTTKSGVVPQADNDGNKVLYADGSWKTVDLAIVGNAETAEKLKTARTIAISGAVTGTATSFDGSKNITIPTTAVDASKVVGTVASASLATFADNATSAGEAYQLAIPRKIHGVDFDGTEDIELDVFSVDNSGLVPQSDYNEGDDVKFLGDDGSWQEISLERLNGLAKGDAYKDAFTNDVMYFGDANQSEGVEAYQSVDDLPVGRVLISKNRDITNKPNCNGDAFLYIETKSIYFEDEVGRLQVARGYSNGYVEMRSRGIKNTWSEWAVMAFTTSNVASSTKLQNARTIAISGAVTGTATSFDGSKNIAIPTIAVDATKLSGIISKDRLSGTYEITVNGTSDSAIKLLNARKIQVGGGVVSTAQPYDGTENITIPVTSVDANIIKGVVYSATKASMLTIPRKINNVAFDGSGDIDLILIVQDNVDFDTFITPQTVIINSTNGKHKPTTEWGVLEVIGKGERIYQRYTDDVNLIIYLRVFKDGNWSQWTSIAPNQITDFCDVKNSDEELELNKISKVQFQLVLLEENRLDDFESLIFKISDKKIRRKVEILYQSNVEFKRESELLHLIVQAKVLTDKELDAIWKKAIKLVIK